MKLKSMKLKSINVQIDDPNSVAIVQEAALKVNITPDQFVQNAVSTFAAQLLRDDKYAEHVKECWNEA